MVFEILAIVWWNTLIFGKFDLCWPLVTSFLTWEKHNSNCFERTFDELSNVFFPFTAWKRRMWLSDYRGRLVRSTIVCSFCILCLTKYTGTGTGTGTGHTVEYSSPNHGRRKRGDGGDASPPVKNLGGDVPPDSRMKWPKSGAISDFWVFGGSRYKVGQLPTIRPYTQKSLATPLPTVGSSGPFWGPSFGGGGL